MPERPKLETVAKRAGVSVATASQVMRGAGRISEATRKRVLQAARDLHYVPNNRAAAMRSGSNNEIGFVINQLANPFNAEVISGVSDLLEAEGYLVSVLDGRDDPERQKRHLESFIRHGRGGLLWVPAAETPDEIFNLLAAHRTPVVTFLRKPERGDFDHVGIRNTEATREATAHLADLGHRHIGYLGGVEMTMVRRERIAGYRAILSERGLATPVIWDCGDTLRAGSDALVTLRQEHPELTAIVCNGDMVALGASLALSRQGLRPGEDFSIVGFDDIENAALAAPALTTLAVSPYHLGRRLARVLLDRMQEPDLPVATSDVSARLMIRETTGPAPDSDAL